MSGVQHLEQIGGSGRCEAFRASMGSPYDLIEYDEYAFEISLGSDYKFKDEATWMNTG